MEAVQFKECNTTFAKNQSEYISLPANMSTDGIATCCWKLSFLDKLRVLWTGYVFSQVITFHKPLQPLKLIVKKPYLEN